MILRGTGAADASYVVPAVVLLVTARNPLRDVEIIVGSAPGLRDVSAVMPTSRRDQELRRVRIADGWCRLFIANVHISTVSASRRHSSRRLKSSAGQLLAPDDRGGSLRHLDVVVAGIEPHEVRDHGRRSARGQGLQALPID